MPLYLPGSLEELLSLFGGCFTQPTFQTFRALLAGQISQTGLRTVTGMLIGARLSAIWHHCRAHHFFSRRRWSAEELGLRMLELIVERLVDRDAPILVAVDDTLAKRLGRFVFGCHWHHDATANAKQGASAWGNCWVVAGIVVRLRFLKRSVCLPVTFRLWRPKRGHIPKGKPDPERPSKPELARQIVDLIAERLPERRIDVVGDAAYASRAWRGLPARVSVTFRLRADAALYAPAPPRTGKRGQPAKWGKRLPSLTQIATDPATRWVSASARRYGQAEAVELFEIDCLWGPLGAETPVRVILVKDAARPSGYELALLTTDLRSAPAKVVERYAGRWPIEVAFEEAKHVFGVGEARNRAPLAVERTVPFQFLCMTLTIVWYALYGHHPGVVAERRARAPWYLSKADPSTADMLAKLRRVMIAAQYRRGGGPTPEPVEIAQVQAAWAAAGV